MAPLLERCILCDPHHVADHGITWWPLDNKHFHCFLLPHITFHECGRMDGQQAAAVFHLDFMSARLFSPACLTS